MGTEKIEIFEEGYGEKVTDFMILYLQKLEKLSPEERIAITRTIRLLNMPACLLEEKEQEVNKDD